MAILKVDLLRDLTAIFHVGNAIYIFVHVLQNFNHNIYFKLSN